MNHKKYHRIKFFVRPRESWYIVPTIIIKNTPNLFLETGVTSSAWVIQFVWLKFGIVLHVQEDYEH